MRAVSKGLLAAMAAVVCFATVASGCGSSSKSSSTSSSGAVIRAADTTAQVAGYRLAGTMTINSARTGRVSLAVAGTFNHHDGVGQMTTAFEVGRNRLQLSELISHLSVYLRTSTIPTLAKATGGKPWVKLDVGGETGALGLSALPTSTDPTQFVDYLRAVSSSTKPLGTLMVRGVETNGYRATVDLDRYPNLVAPSQRAAVARGVKSLETATGVHTIPMDVWVDRGGLVRRLGMSFAECAQGTTFVFSMDVDLYDFGTQANPRIPAASQVYDLTPLVARDLKSAKAGCS